MAALQTHEETMFLYTGNEADVVYGQIDICRAMLVNMLYSSEFNLFYVIVRFLRFNDLCLSLKEQKRYP